MKKTKKQSSDEILLSDISIVIPVKDNQRGVDTYLKAFIDTQLPENYPKEIIVVDNNSRLPIETTQWQAKTTVPIRLYKCLRPGAGAARNKGVEHSTGKWILFNDSDCIPTPSLLTGYLGADNGSLGYAGNVKSLGLDSLSQYYESQEILIPLKVRNQEAGFNPQYLITANCLVWREAFVNVNGFNERITIAGGEDIDLGLRLSRSGSLSYAFGSLVMHNFDDGIKGFCKRFKRYGRGNRVVEDIWKVKMRPRPFKPNNPSFLSWFYALLQYLFLMVGYSIQDATGQASQL